MKAIVQNDYDSPDALELKEINKPEVTENGVLVRVCAASVNAGDYFSLKGEPWLARLAVGFPKPKDYIPGWDVSGHVEQVGKDVQAFHPGDEVFGSRMGGFAEYACLKENTAAHKPAKSRPS